MSSFQSSNHVISPLVLRSIGINGRRESGLSLYTLLTCYMCTSPICASSCFSQLAPLLRRRWATEKKVAVEEEISQKNGRISCRTGTYRGRGTEQILGTPVAETLMRDRSQPRSGSDHHPSPLHPCMFPFFFCTALIFYFNKFMHIKFIHLKFTDPKFIN